MSCMYTTSSGNKITREKLIFYLIKTGFTLESLVSIWSGALMYHLNQSSCVHVGITCLFEHVATSRDSLLQTDGRLPVAAARL